MAHVNCVHNPPTKPDQKANSHGGTPDLECKHVCSSGAHVRYHVVLDLVTILVAWNSQELKLWLHMRGISKNFRWGMILWSTPAPAHFKAIQPLHRQNKDWVWSASELSQSRTGSACRIASLRMVLPTPRLVRALEISKTAGLSERNRALIKTYFLYFAACQAWDRQVQRL